MQQTTFCFALFSKWKGENEMNVLMRRYGAIQNESTLHKKDQISNALGTWYLNK